MPTLIELTEDLQAVLADIEEMGDDLDAELQSRINTIGLDWQAKLVACALKAQSLAAEATAWREVADRKAKVARAKANAAKGLKRYILLNLQAAGSSGVEDAEMGVRVRICRSPASLEIIDEVSIPKLFWLPQPPKLDRSAVLAALKNDQDVVGARLVTDRHHVHID